MTLVTVATASHWDKSDSEVSGGGDGDGEAVGLLGNEGGRKSRREDGGRDYI